MMKTLKFLLLFFICIGARVVFSQTYYPITDTNAVWDVVLYPDPENPFPPMYENHFEYRLEGDTLINNITYQKLIRTTINTLCSVDTFTDLHGFLRNDIESHKVYYRARYQIDELLLYDFSLQVGDTLKGSVFITMTAFTVGAIDSILINDYYHKRYSIFVWEDFTGDYLIEGIGTSVGLIEPISGFWPFYKLRCYSENGQLGYLSPWATECRLESDTCYVGIEEQTDEPKVQIFPNPVRDYLYVYLNTTKQENPDFLFTLYDITGRIIYQDHLFNSLMLDCSSYSRGLVYYRISSTTNQPVISGKILFQ